MSSTKRISTTLINPSNGIIASVEGQPTGGPVVETIQVAIFSVLTEPSPQELADIEATGVSE
ncbi:hypothetical protein BGX26_003490, partial [Mortierella sp. AD094]